MDTSLYCQGLSAGLEPARALAWFGYAGQILGLPEMTAVVPGGVRDYLLSDTRAVRIAVLIFLWLAANRRRWCRVGLDVPVAVRGEILHC